MAPFVKPATRKNTMANKVEQLNKRIKKLEETVHFLTELLTERQLEAFMSYLNRQKSL